LFISWYHRLLLVVDTTVKVKGSPLSGVESPSYR
jgi:hypothetical protein